MADMFSCKQCGESVEVTTVTCPKCTAGTYQNELNSRPNHGSKPPPTNTRPFQFQHSPGAEWITQSMEGDRLMRQTWRQVGWHGQSGAFYSLWECPENHEPGSFAPLWILVHNSRVEPK